MTSLVSEPRLSLNALAQREQVHLSTVWRWCLRGVKGHKLESLNVGGKKFTSVPAFERWIARINGEASQAEETQRQRQRAIDAAERELDAIFESK
jgi:hypothetical protein